MTCPPWSDAARREPTIGQPAPAAQAFFAQDELHYCSSARIPRPQRHLTTAASSLVDITGLFAFLPLFQWLVGGPLALAQVRIGPMRREDVQPFLRRFGAPVLALGRHYRLEFSATDPERPVVRTRAGFAAFFEVYPCAVFDGGARSPAEQVPALLARGELGVGAIGEWLGFRDAAAFRRAFRRWHGCAPAAARLQGNICK